MNTKLELERIKEEKFFLEEIAKRQAVIDDINETNVKLMHGGWFDKLAKLFKLKVKQPYTACLDGHLYDFDIDIFLKEDVKTAFEKSIKRLEDKYKETVDFYETRR